MRLSERSTVIVSVILAVGFIYLLRLFYIQVVDESWQVKAASISERHQTIYPARGLIYDRNGKLMVANTPVYDLMVVPKDVKKLDTTEFCDLVGLDRMQFVKRLSEAAEYSQFKPSIFEKQIPAETFSLIAEKLYKYPGFFGQSRTLRYYPKQLASHALGYVSEVSPKRVKRNPYYQPGDYIGASGVESTYEKALRGQRGKRYIVVDVHNNEKGSYKAGAYDTLAVSGKNLTSSLDIDLQRYGERLMHNKKGSIVAIEPKTGEILSLVTSPNYDPDLLVGRVRGKNYRNLSCDTLKPLFNRALMARYPPGSTFKLAQALIGLQEGVIDTNSTFECHQGYYYGGRKLGCHNHRSPVGFKYSIQTSCNAYYCNVFKGVMDKYPTTQESYRHWRKHLKSFGFGKKLHVDLSNEVDGFIPPPSYYNHYYGKGHWNGHTIISLAIGQGEIGVTPIQLANFTATIANRGWYYTPHLIKEVDGKPISDSIFTVKHHTTVDRQNYESVIDGMYRVIERGTGRGVRFSDDIEVCGKTGTAQNPHGKDHSIFIAFAPKDDPKIAVAVFVENVGYGSTWAGPISSLMMEKYLTDSISRGWYEDRIMDADLLHRNQTAQAH